MSFVCIMNNKRKGLVAFTDSKSTAMVNNQMVRDIPAEVPKLYKNNQFIAVTHGNNEIVRNGRIVGLHEPIGSIIEKAPDIRYREFLQLLHAELAETFSHYPETTYCFICGYRDELDPKSPLYGIEQCTVDRAGVHLHGLIFRNTLLYGGNLDMVPRSLGVNPNWTIDDMVLRCEKLYASIVSLGDLFLPYNPVGGTMQLDVFV